MPTLESEKAYDQILNYHEEIYSLLRDKKASPDVIQNYLKKTAQAFNKYIAQFMSTNNPELIIMFFKKIENWAECYTGEGITNTKNIIYNALAYGYNLCVI